MSWWWFLRWVLSRLSLSLLKWSPLLPKSFGLAHLSHGEQAPAATPALLTRHRSLGSTRHKWQQRRKWSQVSARAGFPCDWARPPPFRALSYSPRTSTPPSCPGKAKLLPFSPCTSPTPFCLFYWFSSLFFFPGVHFGRPDVLPQTPPLEKISEVTTIPDPYFSPVVEETLQMQTTRLVPWPLSPYNLFISLFRSLGTSIILFFQEISVCHLLFTSCLQVYFPLAHL